tara:strand:+ start:277 stop:534 length:258 start_codon:yes stop_codon:yes gene_type:complete
MNLMGKKISTLYYTNLAHSINAIAFCVDKGIKVYAVPKNDKEYYVEVNNNGNITRSPVTYGKKEWSEKIYELYVHYYKKYNASDN